MQVTLPDGPQLTLQAYAAGDHSVEQYILDLLARDADRVAILHGLSDMKAGRGQRAEVVEAQLRGK